MKHLDIPVEEFTTPNPITVSESATASEMTDLMKSNGIRHLPILRDGRVVGIVSERDLKVALGLSIAERKQIRAADIMAGDPVTVSAGQSLREVAFEMSKAKIGSVIVNDEEGEFLGIFTVTDALNALVEMVED